MFEQLVVGGKVELFKKSRRIKENGETKEMLVSQIMDINDETIICTMPSRQGKMIVLEVGNSTCKVPEKGILQAEMHY